MILPDFEYLAPTSLQAACNILRNFGSGSKIMAGGTDLINPMKDKVLKPNYVIDIKNIPNLDQLEFDAEKGLKIGALTKIRDIECSPVIKREYPALAEAAHVIASTQIRSKGTMVGNICNASPSADSVPALLVLDATLKVTGPEGSRNIPISEFFVGFKKLALEPDEVVTAITVPAIPSDTRAAYIKHAYRKAMDLAIVGVAASVTMAGEKCTGARIALGAVAPTAVRSPSAEAVLIGKVPAAAVLEEAGVAAMKDCAPISDIRASAEYRRDMVRVFTRRAIQKALEQF
ncbi:MAG: xanthine dehydrogenase family protein subunit M [Synergistaceae bacterium]|nr:xanthine dehydrogenase family protein subunit M [Synergistaceae bacterium]